MERKPAQRGADGHDQEGDVEAEDRVDAAEQHEAGRKDHDPDAHHHARTEAIEDPALRGTEQTVLDASERERTGQRRLTPAEVALQQDDVSAEGVEEER